MKRLLVGLLFSGIFSCAVARSAVCLPQLKAGIQYLSDIFLSAQVFARIYVEVPQWTVSPCLILDGGGGFEVGSLFPYPTANLVLGLRFRLRNQHAFTFGSALNYPFWGLPLLHVGYTF